MSKILTVVESTRRWQGLRGIPLPWLMANIKEAYEPESNHLRLPPQDYQMYLRKLLFRVARKYHTLDEKSLGRLLYKCARRSGSGNPNSTLSATGLNYRAGDIVGWEIYDPKFGVPPAPIGSREAAEIEKELNPWSEKLEGKGKEQCYLNSELWLPVHGPYCPVPDTTDKDRRECPICGTIHTDVETPKGYRWRKVDEDYYYPDMWSGFYRWGYTGWIVHVCPNRGCLALAEPFRHKQWRKPEKIFLNIFSEVIKYANYNKDIRRAAEDFVRYAGQVFSRGDDSAGCQSRSEIMRQCIEVSRD